MSLEGFHPVGRQWFSENFPSPSEIQILAWPMIREKRDVLMSAPTGSGKTLAAFLSVMNDLFERSLEGTLEERTQVVYVSPLKALSNDIHRNLQVPLRGIKALLAANGYPEVDLRAMVRTGDTPTRERVKMTRTPPHILVTTPESLYLLLTSASGREMLSHAGTLIVDEIHAVAGNKRGAHLSLSVERLARRSRKPLHRIGISATQKPIERMADFLTGGTNTCQILNIGHRRELELDIELPGSPLTAVMANEVWEEIHQKLEDAIQTHRTTLIFVQTRSMAERLSHHLTERLGPEVVSAHHGSMSREKRLDAEMRLKSGALKALVATASLELGIDVGSIDLVVQIGSAKSIAALLQRVGRSGHTLTATPKEKLYPLTKDELIEAVALLDNVRRGELDNLPVPEKPLDVLAQQIVAEVASEETTTDALYDLVRRSFVYRNLTREEFHSVVQMLVDGFTFRRGNRRSYLHFNPVTRILRAKKGARLIATISGGTIPDQFDYDVRLEPSGVQIGSVHEDFAVESIPGDIFQLGTASWRILKVVTGKVYVEVAQGLPPTMPFWLGEGPGRSAELSASVSRIRKVVSARIKLGDSDENASEEWKRDAVAWLCDQVGTSEAAADQVVTYLAASKASLGRVPSQNHIVLERFFDDVGDQHLVIHSVFGSRLNRAWGLALRKRFCRKLNDSLKKPTPRSKLRGIYGFLPFGTGRRPTRCFLGTLQRAAGNDQVQLRAASGRQRREPGPLPGTDTQLSPGRGHRLPEPTHRPGGSPTGPSGRAHVSGALALERRYRARRAATKGRRTGPPADPARRDLHSWIERWADRYPKLCTWVEDTSEETFTFYRLPRAHHKHLKSTNMLERLNQEIKRRTQIVRIFPNAQACLRLVRARAVEIHEDWIEAHRYLNMDTLNEHLKLTIKRKSQAA